MRSLAILVPLALSVASTALAADAPGDEAISANPSLSVIARSPEFSLRDPSGQLVRLSSYQGCVVLLAFVFTTCPGMCPLISKQMSALQVSLKQEGLFGHRANLVSVTVDPETDTAAVLAKYAKSYGAGPAGWRFLRETPEKTKPALKAYDEWTKLLPKGEFDHPARVYLIDQRSNIREIYSLAFFNEKQALIDIEALLADASRKAVASRGRLRSGANYRVG
jgi:protein SCO1/2